MNTVESGSFFFRKSWVILVILSFLPALILSLDWDPDTEIQSLTFESHQSWLSKTDSIAEKLRLATSLDYWIHNSSLKFKAAVEFYLQKNHSAQEAFVKAKHCSNIYGLPGHKIWAFYKCDKKTKIVVDPDFERKSSYFFIKLFDQILAVFNQNMSESVLYSAATDRFLKFAFGEMFGSKFFSKIYRDYVVPVIFRNKSCLLVWDFITAQSEEKAVGAYFMLYDAHDSQRVARELVFNYWAQISGKAGCFPVLLATTEAYENKVILPKLLDTSENRKLFHKFWKENFGTRFAKEQGAQKEIKLPAEKLGQVLEIGGFQARLCPLSKRSKFVGLIVSPKESIQKSSRKLISELVIFFIAVFWLMFALKRIILPGKDDFSFHSKLLCLFLVVGSIPVCLAVGAWSSLMQDLKKEKVEDLEREIRQRIISVENSVGQIRRNFWVASKKILAENDLSKKIDLLLHERISPDSFMKKLEDDYKRAGINPSALMLLTQGGWIFSVYRDGAEIEFVQSTSKIIGTVFGKYLEQASTKLSKKYEGLGAGLDPSYRVNSLAKFKQLRVKQNLKELKKNFGKVSDFGVGKKHYLHFYDAIFEEGGPLGILVTFWDCSENYRPFIKRSIAENSVLFSRLNGFSIDIGVFEDINEKKYLKAGLGNVRGLVDYASLSGGQFVTKTESSYVVIKARSENMPGYSYVVRADVHGVELEILKEKTIIAISLIVMLFLVALGVFTMGNWLALPIRQITKKLSLIKNGNLDTKLNFSRDDEVGLAGLTLDRMSDWLIERKRIAEFVAPQVLDAVVDGNLIKAGTGSFQEAVVLVSDIRSFTTISEQFEADEIFDMVNFHLGTMAKIIEDYGGVVDRFVGDAVWAVFYRDEEREYFYDAINAAIKMKFAHNQIQRSRKQQGKFLYDIGIGLDSGRLLAGILGDSAVRLDFSVVGEVLQHAEEVESCAKSARFTGIIISENFYAEIDKSRMRVEQLNSALNVYELACLEEI